MVEVVELPLSGLRALWRRPGSPLTWPCLFTLPCWLEAWTATLGRHAVPRLYAARSGADTLAVAPLQGDGRRLRFLGDPEVIDHQDLVLTPGREAEGVAALWSAWERDGVAELHLERVRPDSQVLRFLAPLARKRGAAVAVEPAGVSVEVALPGTWDGYLGRLEKKQRHELRRKLRRLHAAGAVGFRTARSAGEDLQGILDGFFRLFRASRADKDEFLTPGMERYFRVLIETAARDGLLNLGMLEFDGILAAATLCFDHGGRTHLYNNGYSRDFAHLGVGLLSKVLSLRDSLERGMVVYDLLAGDEAYKFQLGGAAVPLSRCVIRLQSSVGVP